MGNRGPALRRAASPRKTLQHSGQPSPSTCGLPSIDGKTPAGNCDLCFLKIAQTISAILRTDPGLADWWIRMEDQARPNTPLAGVFRKDRPNYRRMRDAVLAEQAMDFGEQDRLAECFCHE